MKLQPLADRIVAKEVEAPAKTASGILIPDSARKKTRKGDVIKVGKDVKEVKVGDRVFYSEYGPVTIEDEDDGKEYLLIKEEDVLAVVKG